MSPEQARGKTVDKRTDIWAFGCVVYEVLVGRPPFAGETFSDTIAAVLQREPLWNALPDTTPPAIRRLLRRCLEKDPRQRLRDIGDARVDIAQEPVHSPALISAQTLQVSRREQSAWALAALGAIATLVLAASPFVRQGRSDEGAQMVRSVIGLPPAHSLELASGSLFAVSPDGTQLVYSSASQEGQVALYLRPLHEFQSNAIAGTAGATHPFFSPDGRWVGFFANGTLKKVSLDGGTPTVICDTPVGHGASWAPDNTIVFTRPGSGLMRVSADGGTPQPATKLNAKRGETGHDWPQVLPGGQLVLFTIVIGGQDDEGAGFGIAPLEGGETRVVAARRELQADSTTLLPSGDLVQARYLTSGHIVYGQVGAVWGIPFDLAQLEARGSPIQLLDEVFEGPGGGAIYFAVTSQGVLAYVPAGTERTLVRVDRRGRTSPISSTRGPFRLLRLSEDGQRLAVCIDVPGGPTSIWAFDMGRGTPARITSLGHNLFPIWTPDGEQIAYTRSGDLHMQPANGGGGNGELILPRPGGQEPYSWTPDGKTLLFSERHSDSQWDLWAVTLPERVAAPVLVTSDNERLPVVSADGKWLAYVSDESGRYEVYVRPFRGPGARVQVSLEGGTEPVWSRDGKELFFRRQNEYYAAPVQTVGSFDAGGPQFLFAHGLPFVSSDIASYDVTPDGRHFVMIESDPESAPTHFRLVTNWLQELLSRLPSTRAQ
jgi:serine/threonine-protein kinase